MIGRQMFAVAALTAAVLAIATLQSPRAFSAATTAPASTTTVAAAPVATRHPIAAVRPEPLKPPEYRLVYKFHVNEDVHMPLSTDSRMVVQKGPATVTTTNQSTVERHFHVESVDADGSAIVQLFIDSVKLTYSFNNGTPITYDTNKKDSPPRGFEKVPESVGQHGKVRFSPQGKVMALADASLQPSIDPSESFLDPLPAKPVHVGDEWFDDIKVPVAISRSLNQKITLRRRYTLESVDGDVATIQLRTVEITPIQEPSIRAQLVQRAPEGKITFGLSRGEITSRDLNCNRTETGIMGEGSEIAATTHWKGSLR